MDAFEMTVAKLLEADDYWVRPSYKVELTKEEKVRVENPSMPRPEIDLLAYRPGKNEVLAVECKSYFDSPGVIAQDVLDPDAKDAKRYKLFNRTTLREVVLSRLAQQLFEQQLCASLPTIRLAMAVGHFRSDGDREILQKQFEMRGWLLLTDRWLREKLIQLAHAGYDNSVAIISAKLLLRTPS